VSDAQLVLDLQTRPALGRADFFVSPANALALAQVERWPDWPSGRLAVVGPAGAGKTHLAHVWGARSGARILAAGTLAGLDPVAVAEDAAVAVEHDGSLGTASEETLFHLMNRLAAGGGSMLLTGRDPPARWAVSLPDLASRLEAVPVAGLEAPDDALLAAVLVKLFADRQIPVGPEVVRYLAARMERSFETADRLVAALDRMGLARHRAVGLRLAAEALVEVGS
jgi:chromosomal replication initiation ATPase DnaA